MNERQDPLGDETLRAEETLGVNSMRGDDSASIGTGKKTGIYGCGFAILAVVIIFILLALTGIYTPFQGMEGVGP